MAASVSVSLWSRIWESSPKLSKILATTKHYQKTFLIKQLLSSINSRFRTQTLKSSPTSCTSLVLTIDFGNSQLIFFLYISCKKRLNILKKMNSLMKGEGVPLLNFEGGPGVLLLNFEGGPGVPFLNFRGSRVPFLKFKGGPGWVSESWSHSYTMPKI